MLVRRVVLVVVLASLLALAPAGCANPGSMPRLHMNVTVGPKAHQAVVLIKGVTDRRGGAYAGVVLTYPDGRRRLLDTFTFGAHDVDYRELDGLPSGVYTCTAYAVPVETNDELIQHDVRGYKPFPVSKMVRKHMAASATFVIP